MSLSHITISIHCSVLLSKLNDWSHCFFLHSPLLYAWFTLAYTRPVSSATEDVLCIWCGGISERAWNLRNLLQSQKPVHLMRRNHWNENGRNQGLAPTEYPVYTTSALTWDQPCQPNTIAAAANARRSYKLWNMEGVNMYFGLLYYLQLQGDQWIVSQA